MKKISCSCTWGDGNLNHNFNKNSRSRQEHINSEKIQDNIILKNISPQTIEEEFNKIFDEDIKEYNQKQIRNDRKIKSYYQKVLNDKKIRAPFREVIYQVGKKEDLQDIEIKDKMIKTLERFYEEFETNYPRLKIIGGVIHLDEATPHLHLDVVPYAENNKKGLKHKVSFEKAIEQMGFTPEQSNVNKSDKVPLVFNGFRNHSMKLLEDLLNGAGLQRDVLHNTDKHLSVKDFKEKKAIEDLKKSPEIQEKAKQELLSKMETKDNLQEEIIYLQNKKAEEEKNLFEFEEHKKKEKERLFKEYEKEKQKYNARIIEMQNTTIEKEQYKQSFWQRIEEMVAKSKLVATICYAMTLYDAGNSGKEIFSSVKKFRKRYDRYKENSELLKEEMEVLKKDPFTKLSITDIENSELEGIEEQHEYDDLEF